MLVASLDEILSIKRITKAVIRLHRCAGWSASVLSQTPKDRFSRVEAHIIFELSFPLCMLGKFACFYGFFFKINLFRKKIPRNTIRLSNSLNSYQARPSVGPDLNSNFLTNCLERLSAVDTNRQRDKVDYIYQTIFLLLSPHRIAFSSGKRGDIKSNCSLFRDTSIRDQAGLVPIYNSVSLGYISLTYMNTTD